MTVVPRAADPLVVGEAPRGATVARSALVATLCHASEATVVLLSGPAGAGKSTLAEQWRGCDPRPHAVVRIGPHLDDPARLAEAVIDALGSIGPEEPEAAAHVTGQDPSFSSVVLPGLAALMAGRASSYVLVLDDVHLLHDPHCLELVRTLAASAPPGSALALLSRESAPRWLARARAERRLLVLDADDLAFDADEVEDLLDSFGIDSDLVDRAELLQRTEGWAVAVYLEALALRESGTRAPRRGSGTADLSIVQDYIEAEVLDPMPETWQDFLVRTSILDETEPSLCDAVLGRADSAMVLAALRRSTPLVVGTGDASGYRYHHLLRDTLRSRLAASHDAEAVHELHRRASAWYLRHGGIDAAVHHAHAAGSLDATAALIWPHVIFSVASGRPDSLARWLDELGPDEVDADRWLTLAAAWSALQAGDGDAMRRQILRSEAHAGRGWRARVPVDEYAASLAPLLALEGRVDLAEAAELCRGALEGLRPDDPWRCVAAFLGGVCLTLLRDPEASSYLLEAQLVARAFEVHLVEADSQSWRGMLALMSGDVAEGTALIAEATALLEQHDLARLVTSAHSYTAQALADSVVGDRERASFALAVARRLTVASDGIAPWFQVCGRLVQARAALALDDVDLARLLVSEARTHLTPDLARSLAQDLLEATESVLAQTASSGRSAMALTAAELRVLQFLPSHLTFPQIGEHMFLSANTVKTHALAIYRKLGATSRNEAVMRARSLGLVEAPMRG